MLWKPVRTKNLVKFCSAYEELAHRGERIPGIALVYGPSGQGKSTAAEYCYGQIRAQQLGIFVEASPAWSANESGCNAMVRTLLRLLGADPKRSSGDSLEHLVSILRQHSCPVFLDEADRIVQGRCKGLVADTLRYIQDQSRCPFIFIGMQDFKSHVQGMEVYAGRVRQITEFGLTDLDDALMLASEVVNRCRIHPDLVTQLYDFSRGSIRRIYVGLDTIETVAINEDWQIVTPDLWADRPFGLGGL